jgi:hypothetical protein
VNQTRVALKTFEKTGGFCCCLWDKIYSIENTATTGIGPLLFESKPWMAPGLNNNIHLDFKRNEVATTQCNFSATCLATLLRCNALYNAVAAILVKIRIVHSATTAATCVATIFRIARWPVRWRNIIHAICVATPLQDKLQWK